MKKRGFDLVGLLIVIAILAVVLIYPPYAMYHAPKVNQKYINKIKDDVDPFKDRVIETVLEVKEGWVRMVDQDNHTTNDLPISQSI